MKAKLVNENLNESKKSIIDYKRLEEYANAVHVLCAGEYGDTFYNEEEQSIWICLGDANPFDEKYLEEFLKEYVIDNYDDRDSVKIIIENESNPNNEDGNWKKINNKKLY